ncbi:hypothetical protein BU26DRAFT_202101 [Trematosphaeria pertusa]|uniref:J domain-containing protein n=1 Tax=Trematosphaeria pertusa TaxID=390896 RepID=A0A6A6HTQ2_9PLEO|nr:uncharacterized protein BU26DRAFT_202101 [Trematosphaeria pertusa]KAF2240903.1 hypothetical protein BU26DRAFT_202101 [Trematosphaeria pertusa]
MPTSQEFWLVTTTFDPIFDQILVTFGDSGIAQTHSQLFHPTHFSDRLEMVGVDFPNLRQVDIFDLLGLDPYALQNLTPEAQLEDIRRAYRRVMLVSHPDKAVENDDGKATLLNVLKDFLCNFDKRDPELWSTCLHIPSENLRKGPTQATEVIDVGA